MMAMAAAKLLQKNQTEAAQQQAQQTAQDPIVQMQQKELEIKQGELDLKKQKLSVDAVTKVKQIEVERERIASQKEIAGAQLGAKTAKDKAELDAKQRLEGIRIGAQTAKERDQMQYQREQANKPQPNKPTKGE
jgi:hypothetical protein